MNLTSFSRRKWWENRAYDQRLHFDFFEAYFYASSSFTVVLGSVN